MRSQKNTRKDLYYTTDNDWVDFHGAIAYVGVTGFKLSGFKEIHHIFFHEPSGLIKQGKIIVRIIYNTKQIEVKMPVNGKLLEVNKLLDGSGRQLLLQHPETTGWLVKINPAQPYERKGLLLHKDYLMNGKSKFAKS